MAIAQTHSFPFYIHKLQSKSGELFLPILQAYRLLQFFRLLHVQLYNLFHDKRRFCITCIDNLFQSVAVSLTWLLMLCVYPRKMQCSTPKQNYQIIVLRLLCVQMHSRVLKETDFGRREIYLQEDEKLRIMGSNIMHFNHIRSWD